MKYEELSKIFNKEVKDVIRPFFTSQKTGKTGGIKSPRNRKITGSPVSATRPAVVGLVLAFFIFGFLVGMALLPFVADEIAEALPDWKERLFGEREALQEPVLAPSKENSYSAKSDHEAVIISAVNKASPAVVSIVITKDVPILEKYYESPDLDDDLFKDLPFRIEYEIPKYREKGTEKRTVGQGSGFFVTTDGMILTNKHVVSDETAEYTVITDSGERYIANVVSLDPLQDLAILKIDRGQEIDDEGHVFTKPLPILTFSNEPLQIGQTVITIGNALGEFQNAVSLGVVSGLRRTITASSGDTTELLENVIQTDAAINKGNSGGPLLNLKGEVVGVNVAMAEGAQQIGFSIPADTARMAVEKVKRLGKIVYPFLGIRYRTVDFDLQQLAKLPVDYGAVIVEGEGENEGVVPDSAADQAGLKEGDIILEINGKRIDRDNLLSKVIKQYMPGDTITLTVLREEEKLILTVVLGEID